MANEIGGAGVNCLTEDDLSSHPSLTNICNANKSNQKNFCFQPLSINSVQSALEKLNVRKASGYDSISPRMLRLASSGIADSLTKLFNECIRKGEWPAAWKKGEWNPVHKKDDRLDERNYRPITLLSTVDKVYESMMSIKVNNHFAYLRTGKNRVVKLLWSDSLKIGSWLWTPSNSLEYSQQT